MQVKDFIKDLKKNLKESVYAGKRIYKRFKRIYKGV